MEKYYWMRWECISKTLNYKDDGVFKEHPFIAIARKRKKYNKVFKILNFKEITKEEYDLYSIEL